LGKDGEQGDEDDEDGTDDRRILALKSKPKVTRELTVLVDDSAYDKLSEKWYDGKSNTLC